MIAGGIPNLTHHGQQLGGRHKEGAHISNAAVAFGSRQTPEAHPVKAASSRISTIGWEDQLTACLA